MSRAPLLVGGLGLLLLAACAKSDGPALLGAGGAGGSGNAGGAGGAAASGGGGAGGSGGTGGSTGATGGTGGTATGGSAGAGGCDPTCASPGCGDCDGDPTNGCEQALTDAAHCGACGRTCAATACDPAGACTPELVRGGGRVHALGVGAPGVAFGFYVAQPASASVWLAGAAGTPQKLGDVATVPDRVAVDGAGVVFSMMTRGVFTFPLAGGAMGDLRNGDASLLGIDPTSAWVVQRFVTAPFYGLDRVDRATRLHARRCTSEFLDGAPEPEGTLLVGNPLGLWRYDYTGAGPACDVDVRTPLVAGYVPRLVVGGGDVHYILGSGGEVRRQPRSGGAEVVEGVATAVSGGAYALAADATRVAFWQGGFVLVRHADGRLTRAAAMAFPPNALGLDASWVYLGDDAGLWRVPAPP